MADFKQVPTAATGEDGVSGYLAAIPGSEFVPEWVLLLGGMIAVGFVIYLISRLFDELTAGH